MNWKPQRHWFRFSLSTLFVVVTLACLWCGGQYRIVHERREVRKLVTELGGIVGPPRDDAEIGWFRRLLGDESVKDIVFYDYIDVPADAQERIRDAFPEAGKVTIEAGMQYKDGRIGGPPIRDGRQPAQSAR